ncbi:MAG: tetratricopeptide repeat protein [Desulfobacterales bacterium]
MQPTSALNSLGTHLKTALRRYFQRVWHLIGIVLASLLVSALVGAGLSAAGLFGSRALPQHRLLVTGAAAALGALALVWLVNWGATAAMVAIVHREFSVRRCLWDASGKVLSAIWLTLLLGFVMTGAVFLVVPWVLFSVWFYFAPFVLADGDTRGMSALLKSREYVRGYWFSVFLRIIFIWGLYALLVMVPLAGPILALAFFPFVLFYNGVLYENLKDLRGGVWFFPRSSAKAGILVTSTLGYIAPPLVLLAVMGPMLWQVFDQYAPFRPPRPPAQTFNAATPPPRLLDALVSDILYKIRGAQEVSAAKAIQAEPLPSPWSTASETALDSGPHSAPAAAHAARDADDIPQWLRQGEVYLTYGNYRAAIENFERVIARDPANSAAHFNRGMAYGEIGDFAAALAAIDRAVRVAPANGLYYYGRGRLLLLQGDRAGAREDFRQAVALGYQKAAAYL